ncbi:MAG: DUF4332 domain-containing protein [Cytophagales bacterium]|nr:MAG: DUF4332 domain-containing protein [Cytophagales bacterium]
MGYLISEIEGIGPAYAEKLKKEGFSSVESFLEKAATKKGREEIAKATGIADSHILKWANHADLFRIKGVAGQFAELLEASGVDTVKEFRNRNAANLKVKMEEVNAEKKLTGRVPSESQLQGMIDIAKGLEPKVSH